MHFTWCTHNHRAYSTGWEHGSDSRRQEGSPGHCAISRRHRRECRSSGEGILYSFQHHTHSM